MKFLSKMMRTAAVVAALFIICLLTSFAAVPHWINYQGHLTRPDGTPLDTTVSIIFRLYPELASGTPVWDEIHTVTTVNGIYDVLLGSADNFPETFFDDGSMWLGIQVGTDAEMSPRIDLASVPYAYRIGTVDEAQGGTINGDVIILGQANIGAGNTNVGDRSFVVGESNSSSGYNSSVTGGRENEASGYLSFIGGGTQHSATGNYCVVAGGTYNRATATAATVGGGEDNQASGISSAVSGGVENIADATSSTVSGGAQNIAHSDHSTVSGGRINYANGEGSAISGGGNNTTTNLYSTIGGGRYNKARGNYSVIAGGGGDTPADSNSAQGNLSFIGGGYHNYATGDAACIAGGYYHTASGNSATIGGGYRNTSTNFYSTVGGGTYNDATGQYATIAGGRHNVARGTHSFIGGGGGATADSNSVSGSYSAIAGGSGNTANGTYAFVGGGRNNFLWGGANSVICGGGGQSAGTENQIFGSNCVIGGGEGNYMANDMQHEVLYGVIGGGRLNEVQDTCGTVPGGQGNIARSYSFAAGRNAQALDRGCFVWSDASSDSIFATSADYQFFARATGGVKFITGENNSSGVSLNAGSSSWISVSDSTKKRNIVIADCEALLNAFADLPIKKWEYKSEPEGVQHYGPMAQDFWNAFHLGTDSLGIETLDADGVLFAAVKALIARDAELMQSNRDMQNEITFLRSQIQSLMAGQAKASMEINREVSK